MVKFLKIICHAIQNIGKPNHQYVIYIIFPNIRNQKSICNIQIKGTREKQQKLLTNSFFPEIYQPKRHYISKHGDVKYCKETGRLAYIQKDFYKQRVKYRMPVMQGIHSKNLS